MEQDEKVGEGWWSFSKKFYLTKEMMW